jgi:hypothetical protein
MRHLFIGPDICPTRDLPCNYPLWHLLSLMPPNPVRIISTSIPCTASRTFGDFGCNHLYLASDLLRCYTKTVGHILEVNVFLVLCENKNKTHQPPCGLWLRGRLSGWNFLVSRFLRSSGFYGQMNNYMYNLFKKWREPHRQLFNVCEMLLSVKC